MYDCRVSLFKDREFSMVPNLIGEFSTPSYVAFTESGVVVGHKAKQQLLINSQNTIFNFKRLIGKRYSDVQNFLKTVPYRVDQGPGDKPLIVVTNRGQVQKLYPEDVYAILIETLKDDAERFIGQLTGRKDVVIKDVVVTVPTFFNRSQIFNTINSCKKDKLNVLRTIKESQAIALGIYSVQPPNINEKNVLIYNLGHSSCDVAIINICEQVFEVKSTHGDS